MLNPDRQLLKNKHLAIKSLLSYVKNQIVFQKKVNQNKLPMEFFVNSRTTNIPYIVMKVQTISQSRLQLPIDK